MSKSWLEPVQARHLLEDAGFTIEASYGDFDKTAFSSDRAREQIWIARKPA